MSVLELFLNRFESYKPILRNVLRLSSETEIILNRKMHRFTEIMTHLKILIVKDRIKPFLDENGIPALNLFNFLLDKHRSARLTRHL